MTTRECSIVYAMTAAVAVALAGIDPAGAQELPVGGESASVDADYEIASIRPFATADSVIIETEVALKAESKAPQVDLYAYIREWPGGRLFWEGKAGTADFRRGRSCVVNRKVTGLKPNVWDVRAPQLYTVTVTAGLAEQKRVRFGFRSVEARGGRILLNGKPVFLRGLAVNPPDQGMAESVWSDRQLARRYIGMLQDHHVNCIRTAGSVWLDACDELGMLAISGQYGLPPGSIEGEDRVMPPLDLRESVETYKRDILGPHANHPSVIVNMLGRGRPEGGRTGPMFDSFLESVYRVLREWDPTRLYLTAGSEAEYTGDLRDRHAFAGWYSGSFLDYYDLRHSRPMSRPLTFTECGAAFTDSEGRFRVDDRHLGPALAWGGHASNQVEVALEYQSFQAKRTLEMLRRLRRFRPDISAALLGGNTFYHWNGVQSLEEMAPKPVMQAVRTAYQPVLLSLENWTPNVYPGAVLEIMAHMVNDHDSRTDLPALTLTCELVSPRRATVARQTVSLPPLPYYRAATNPLSITLPEDLEAGQYLLRGRLSAGGEILSVNTEPVFVGTDERGGGSRRRHGQTIRVYDEHGRTDHALKRLGFDVIPFTDFNALDEGSALVIGAESWDPHIARHHKELQNFVQRGGRVLVLRQAFKTVDYGWLGTPLEESVGRGETAVPGIWINPERPDHAVFRGITRRDLRIWSDPSGWVDTQDGHPDIYPVHAGYRLREGEGLVRTAILANYGSGLQHIALSEVFDGKGSVLISGFAMVNRAGKDPVADRLLGNMVDYLLQPGGHEPYPLVNGPIQWGDYPSERGLVAGPVNGLVPCPANPFANPEGAGHVEGAGAAPRGRRPVGLYGFDTEGRFVQHSRNDGQGWGRFFCRVPPGKRRVLTRVMNPSEAPGIISMTVNGQPGERRTFKSREQGGIGAPIPEGVTELAVEFHGASHLVLLETRFE